MLKTGPTWGIAWMCMATLLSSIVGGMVRELGGAIPTMELVLVRNVVALAVLVPWMARRGVVRPGAGQLPVYGLRVLFAYLAMLMLFHALGHMPIADVYALQYTIPIFTIFLAVLVLKQRADARGWTACLVGFAGALVVMRPGIVEITLASLAALGSAFLSAGSNTTIKMLSRGEGAGAITAWTNLLMLPLALVPTLFVWVTPSWEQLPWVLAIGAVSSVGGYCFTRSVAAADARVVQPFQFSRMIFAAAIGYAMFAELPDLWTWVGAGIIFAASYDLLVREQRRHKAAVPMR